MFRDPGRSIGQASSRLVSKLWEKGTCEVAHSWGQGSRGGVKSRGYSEPTNENLAGMPAARKHSGARSIGIGSWDSWCLRGSGSKEWAQSRGPHTAASRQAGACACSRAAPGATRSVAVLGVALGSGLAGDALHLVVGLERPLVLGGPLAGQDVGGV